MQEGIKEIKDNFEMGMLTENEYFNQCIDVILRHISLPCKVGEELKPEIDKFNSFIDKIIS